MVGILERDWVGRVPLADDEQGRRPQEGPQQIADAGTLVQVLVPAPAQEA